MSLKRFYGIIQKKRLDVELQGIMGLGIQKSRRVCAMLGLNEKVVKMKLDNKGEEYLIKLLKNNELGQVVVQLKQRQIIKKSKNGSYKGERHKLGLPVRGQRTKNNIKTAKKMNTFLLSSGSYLSRLSSKDRRLESRKEKRKKKQEKKK